MSAAMPATNGAAIDVPENFLYFPPRSVDQISAVSGSQDELL